MPTYRVGVSLYAIQAFWGQETGGAANTAGTSYGPWEPPTQLPGTRFKLGVPQRLGPLYNTFEAVVSQSSDDGFEDAASGNAVILTGVLQANETADWLGIRFQSVTIPPGAEIVSARLILSISDGSKNDAEGTWFCEDIDDAPTFTTAVNDISARALTTASVAWTANDIGAVNAVIVTPDLSTCVKEVVDRAGWVDGNDLAFIYDHNSATDHLSFQSFDTTPAPRLVIEWLPTAPAGAAVSLDGTAEVVVEADGDARLALPLSSSTANVVVGANADLRLALPLSSSTANVVIGANADLKLALPLSSSTANVVVETSGTLGLIKLLDSTTANVVIGATGDLTVLNSEPLDGTTNVVVHATGDLTVVGPVVLDGTASVVVGASGNLDVDQVQSVLLDGMAELVLAVSDTNFRWRPEPTGGTPTRGYRRYSITHPGWG